MYRFFVPLDQISEKEAYIIGDDVNHIQNVLRMEKGEKLVLSNGRGNDFICEIREFSEDRISLNILEIQDAISELPGKITLFQALPKGDKMELIIQKAVELGAYEIVPVRTKRCVVKLDDKKAAKKQERWQTIAGAAAKQSGRGIVPQIHSVVSMKEALAMASELEGAVIPYELCENMRDSVMELRKMAGLASVGIFIGPEGGFERGEIEAAMNQGIKPISLGKRILRTETAGMTTLSVLMFEMEARTSR
jgi:16S rRNA (uracil1498-N3)-methyltransferase